MGPRCLVGCLLPLAPHQLVETLTLSPILRDDVTVSTAPPRRRPWALGLRARITVGFSLLGLLVSVGLAIISFYITQQRILKAFEVNSRTVAATKARTARDALRPESTNPQTLLNTTLSPDTGTFVVVKSRGFWFPSDVYDRLVAARPDVSAALEGTTSVKTQLRFDPKGEQKPSDYLVVVIQTPVNTTSTDPATQFTATYVQGFDYTDVRRTLNTLGASLALGATIATLGAASIGLWTSRRVLRPLARVSDAASRLASGGLDTRLKNESDPELQRLATSFNDMADAVQERIQREARFASDVSHELRTPLQTLIGSIEMLDARKADLPDRSRQALELLVGQTKRFHQMVLDLLEISRLDAGAADLHTEPVLLDQFVSRVASRYGYAHVPVITEATWQQQPVVVDRRRLERALANLLGNAENHAGGPVQITLSGASSSAGQVIHVGVEDAGPGVAESERERIFERFARGATARHRAGTGLGLALVHEHIHLQGGRVWVEDRPNGAGARFVIELPAEEE
jgi:two-component system, OmpR family, sensor histidine kinase MtrB